MLYRSLSRNTCIEKMILQALNDSEEMSYHCCIEACLMEKQSGRW